MQFAIGLLEPNRFCLTPISFSVACPPERGADADADAGSAPASRPGRANPQPPVLSQPGVGSPWGRLSPGPSEPLFSAMR